MKPDEAAADQPDQSGGALGALLGKTSPSGDQERSSPDATKQARTESDADPAEDEEVVLRLDGVDQRLKKSEIAAQLAEAKKVAEARSALESTLSDLTSKNEVIQAFNALPQDAQARIREAMRDPSQLGKPQESDGDDDRNVIDEILGDRNTVETRGIKALRKELAERDEVLRHVASFVQRELEARQQATVESEVEGHMRGIPIFDGDDPEASAARQWAKEAILAQYTASGGKANMRDLVVNAAGRLQQILVARDRENQISRDEFVVASGGRVSPRERSTGDDLMSGRTGEKVRRLLGRVSGRAGL